MIDLILTIIFCYQLNRMSKERGIASLPYVMNYIMAIVMMGFILAFGVIYFYGMNALQTEEGLSVAVKLAPITISFEVFLFIFFRNRIRKTPVQDQTNEEEDEHPSPQNPGEKKDLSYFR